MPKQSADPYIAALDRVAKKCKLSIRSPTPAELSVLVDLGVRPIVLRMLERGLLDGMADTLVRVEGFEGIVYENKMLAPGCDVCPKGFVVIGSTHCGDAFALDFNHPDAKGQPPVLLISHERDWTNSSTAEIARDCKRIAETFTEFLESVAEERYRDY